MNHLSKALAKQVKEKINALHEVAHEIPGVVIVHHIPDFTVQYMSRRGLEFFGVTIEDLKAMGVDYYPRYFNLEDSADYVPKIAAMIAKNDAEELVSYFQQVRANEESEWTWHFSTTRIFMHNDDGEPLLSITIALPVDPLQNVNNKVERLLEEKKFLRDNYLLFATLTEREKEVLKLLALSQSAAEIGTSLSISTLTVETHRKNLRKKLGVTTAYELGRFASAFDLI
jgi:DNA-binding CsgD family transcriptional regulator